MSQFSSVFGFSPVWRPVWLAFTSVRLDPIPSRHVRHVTGKPRISVQYGNLDVFPACSGDTYSECAERVLRT